MLRLSFPGPCSGHSCPKGIALVQWTGHPLYHRHISETGMPATMKFRKYVSICTEFVNLIADRIFPGPVISDIDRESPFCAPVWTQDSPPSLAPPADERRVEVSLRLDDEGEHSSQQACSIVSGASMEASLHFPSPPRIFDLVSPTYPLDFLSSTLFPSKCLSGSTCPSWMFESI